MRSRRGHGAHFWHEVSAIASRKRSPGGGGAMFVAIHVVSSVRNGPSGFPVPRCRRAHRRRGRRSVGDDFGECRPARTATMLRVATP